MKACSFFVFCSLMMGAVAVAPHARGGDRPSFSELPVGRMTVPPTRTIGTISYRESVPGLFVVKGGDMSVPVRQRDVTIVVDEKFAASLKRGQRRTADGSLGCLSEVNLASEFDRDRDPEEGVSAREWSSNAFVEEHAIPRTANSPMFGTVAVHTERVVEQNGSATLESLDAWVDPTTGGARLISKASLPLKLMGPPVFGMKVFAGRDERPDGKRFLQFVVVRPQSPTTMSTTQMTMRQGEIMAHTIGCGHARVALPADTADGETATFGATVVLPEQEHANAPPAEMPNAEREVRSRRIHIQVSVSRTSRDKQPLVSVSSSWGGREQVEPLIEAGPL